MKLLLTDGVDLLENSPSEPLGAGRCSKGTWVAPKLLPSSHLGKQLIDFHLRTSFLVDIRAGADGRKERGDKWVMLITSNLDVKKDANNGVLVIVIC